MDVNQTYWGDHFAIYTYMESLCFIPKIILITYQFKMKEKGCYEEHLSFLYAEYVWVIFYYVGQVTI